MSRAEYAEQSDTTCLSVPYGKQQRRCKKMYATDSRSSRLESAVGQ